MLSTLELICYGALVATSPLILYSTLTGTAPQVGPMAPYYRKDSLLLPVGNVFVLVLCGIAFLRLGSHFGFVSQESAASIASCLSGAFMVLFVAYCGVWLRAFLRVRRDAAEPLNS